MTGRTSTSRTQTSATPSLVLRCRLDPSQVRVGLVGSDQSDLRGVHTAVIGQNRNEVTVRVARPLIWFPSQSTCRVSGVSAPFPWKHLTRSRSHDSLSLASGGTLQSPAHIMRRHHSAPTIRRRPTPLQKGEQLDFHNKTTSGSSFPEPSNHWLRPGSLGGGVIHGKRDR